MFIIAKQFVKRYSMRKTPQLGNDYLFFFFVKKLNSVKMSLTRGQSAWAVCPSETQRSAFASSALLSKNKDFINWLVGVTDGDGTFSFSYSNKRKKIWNFSFQISQSSYNLRLLYYIKSNLKVGSVFVDEKNKQAVFRVRNKTHILKHIIPLFDAFPLLTSKHFKYSVFKEALLISINDKLSIKEKNIAIIKLKELQVTIPANYKSPVWSNSMDYIDSKKIAQKVMTKSWLIGFTEAEGSFYIVQKSSTRLVHAFEITQKSDKIVLQAIAQILEISTGVKKKKTYFTVVTTKTETVQFISTYFFKSMKGMKSLEYRLWSRSFNKRKRGFDYLLKIRKKMRNVRSIRFDKNCQKVTN